MQGPARAADRTQRAARRVKRKLRKKRKTEKQNFGVRQVPHGSAILKITSPAFPHRGNARTPFHLGPSPTALGIRPVRPAGARPCPPRSIHVEGACDLRDPARNAGRDYGRWTAL